MNLFNGKVEPLGCGSLPTAASSIAWANTGQNNNFDVSTSLLRLSK